MIRIETIEIDGFKGYDSIDISPRKINIVTGKNNTGKTSLLESINVSFRPGEVRSYDGNVDKLINVHKNEAYVCCEFNHERGQKSIPEFSEREVDSRSVTLKQPTDEQVLTQIEQLYRNRLPIDSQHEEMLSDRISNIGRVNATREQITDIVHTSLEESIKKSLDDHLDSPLLTKFKSHCLNIEVDNSVSRYTYRGSEYDELSNTIGQLTAEAVNSEIVERDLSEQNLDSYEVKLVDSVRFMIENYLRSVNRGRYGRGTFIEGPDDVGEVIFLDDFDITEVSMDSAENPAILQTEIEDFLIEHGIVSGLRDFNLDALVFEEGGDRYSIPYEFMGDGFKSIVGLLWKLKSNEEDTSVVLLEEPENHMHPGYIQELVHFLTELAMNTQLQFFISTHNIDFVTEFFNRTNEYSEFLGNNFQVIQMQEEFAKILPYDTAEENINDLYLDLRGL